MDTLHVDCASCRARGPACSDCVISVLFGPISQAVELDHDEVDALDAMARSGLLPPLRFMAQVRSDAKVNDVDESSWMNLVWYANVDESKTIVDLVREALAQVDWQSQASGFSF